jgi:hypothetical protein
MSPQFVDFNGDGALDIVAGTFDGSPHLALGDGKHWKQPETILDREGQRIVLSEYWDFDAKKWTNTQRCYPEGSHAGLSLGGHATSALAWDFDGDGDLDLLLGDHRPGHVWLRVNEGTPGKAAFATRNTPILVKGKPLSVIGTVATMRQVDWNGDGRMDLACGSMGDAYNDDAGGGIYVYLDRGTGKEVVFGEPIVLVQPSKKGDVGEPTRPDSGLYMDFADQDGDGDLDIVVGGYSHWKVNAPKLTAEQEARAKVLHTEIDAIDQEAQALYAKVEEAVKGLAEEAANARRTELFAAQREQHVALTKKRTPLSQELDKLEPSPKRISYVWLYENTTPRGQ